MPTNAHFRRDLLDPEKTRPPEISQRFDTLADLYAAVPQLAEQTRERPTPSEDAEQFVHRLRKCATPEEAITVVSYVFVPKISIWWGYECLRTIPETLTATDLAMMDGVARWIVEPTVENRHALMKEALWAPEKRPGVHLALAVGWSGGSIAPNDPASVAVHRTPRAVNTAVLTCLAEANISRRGIYMTRFMDVAQSLFRV